MVITSFCRGKAVKPMGKTRGQNAPSCDDPLSQGAQKSQEQLNVYNLHKL